jgi:hypothetical protein
LFGNDWHEYALGETIGTASLADRGPVRHLAVMIEYVQQAWHFHIWAIVAAGAAVLAVISSIADRRRQRRSLINNVGFMPWTAISLFSIGLTLVSVALAIKAG